MKLKFTLTKTDNGKIHITHFLIACLSAQTTPPRTHRVNGVKSQILKPTFLA